MCETARLQLQGEHNVGRVIARPFAGESGRYARTSRRRDFTVPPPSRSLLDFLQAAGREVIGIGKIEDLFSGRGLTRSQHVASNAEALAATLAALREAPAGALLFVNVNDFDTLWGHRNDVAGYAAGLRAFDAWLPELHAALAPGDVCVLTADHGNDPTTPSTDHSREYIPVLAWRSGARPGGSIGERRGLRDIAATILDTQGFDERLGGTSFAAALGIP
jgi:phosphopentomutase